MVLQPRFSGGVGAPGMTTYGENIGVMAVTRVYSTIVFVIAGIFAIFLGFSPKFGAVIHTIPTAILNRCFNRGLWFNYHCRCEDLD